MKLRLCAAVAGTFLSRPTWTAASKHAHMAHATLNKSVSGPATPRLPFESGDVDIARDSAADQLDALKPRSDVRIESHPSALKHFFAFTLTSKRLRNSAPWEATGATSLTLEKLV